MSEPYRYFLGLAFEAVKIFHIDGIQSTEHGNQNGKTNRSFSSSHRQDEENKNLTGCITQEIGESDEIHIHRQQHQFDSHQQDDDVFTIQKNTDYRNRE